MSRCLPRAVHSIRTVTWRSDGSSQSLSYMFTTHVSSGLYTQGEALQLALRRMYLQGWWAWPKYESAQWCALYGNPDLGVGDLPALNIQFPEGVPDFVVPNVDTTFPVRIDPVLDTLVIEPDAGRCQLTWRATVPCSREFLYIDCVIVGER